MNKEQIKEYSRKTFDMQALEYDHKFTGKHARMLYPFLLDEITHAYGVRILDLGCGTGALMELVLAEDPTRIITGLDLSLQMLQVAKKRLGEKAELILGDSECLPFEDNSFDVVYCNDSFHHYPAPDKVLGEICRVLKYGGTFLIGDCYQPFISRLIMNRIITLSKDGDVRIYSKRQMLQLMGEQFHGLRWKKINHQAFIAKGIK